MLEDSEDPVVKTVQPTIKTGRKWKVVEAVHEAKECLKIKEVIGQTQTDRKWLGSSTAKWWSKAEGKEKREMVINEIRLNEDSRRVQKAVQQPQQGQWTNWGKKQDPTCPLCQDRQTTEHVLSSCKIALSQGRYIWKHNRILQELAAIISTAKGETTLPKTNALIFTTEGGAKSWHGRPVRTTNQIKCLLDGCDDCDVSAHLPEWDSHPSIIKETKLRPDIAIHSASTQQLIMVELTVPYENRMEEAHIYKREKYMNLTKELEKMPPTKLWSCPLRLVPEDS